MIRSRKFRLQLKGLLLAGALLAASGCTQAEMDQYWASIPKGYYYNLPEKHDMEAVAIKVREEDGRWAPPPPEVTTYIEPVRATPVQEQVIQPASRTIAANSWAAAADDLVGRLLGHFGTPTDAIYLVPENPNNPLNASFGAALRQALDKRGLTVAAPGMGTFALWFNALDISPTNVQAEIFLLSGKAVAAEASGVYPLVTGGGQRAQAQPVTQQPAAARPISLIPY